MPYDAFAAGIGDYKIVTTLCPGGKERMRRLMSMVQSKRFDPTPLLTHTFKLDQIVEADHLFGSRREGCRRWRSGPDGGKTIMMKAANFKKTYQSRTPRLTSNGSTKSGSKMCR